jgi:hypothetical protein
MAGPEQRTAAPGRGEMGQFVEPLLPTARKKSLKVIEPMLPQQERRASKSLNQCYHSKKEELQSHCTIVTTSRKKSFKVIEASLQLEPH